MNTDILLWPIALFCLWTPSAIFFSANVRERLRHPMRRRDEGIGSLLRCYVNWADLVRGALGGWLVYRLVHNYISGEDDTATVYTAVQFAVLSIAAFVQTIWIDRPIRIIGPAFFFTGLTLAVSGISIGGFALILGFTCALMLRRLSLGFLFVPASIVGFSMAFHEFRPIYLLNALMVALPSILTFIFGTRISYARRPLETSNKGRESERHRKGAGAPALGEPKRAIQVRTRFMTSRERASTLAAASELHTPAILDLGVPSDAGRAQGF